MSDVTKKIGTIIKFAYKPEISSALILFCKTYVASVMEHSDDVNSSEQYDIEDIFTQAEGMKYNLSDEDKEILVYLSKEGIELIEI